jgi:hypothetical protein
MINLRNLAMIAALLTLAACSGSGRDGYYYDDYYHRHENGGVPTGPDRSPGGSPGAAYKPGTEPYWPKNPNARSANGNGPSGCAYFSCNK